jgi:hypothetical protein
MTNEEAAIERSRIVEADRERVAKERSATTEERVQQQALKNSERRAERETAVQSITSGSVNLQEIARQGGALGRRIEREIRRFEQTGQVSSWLAGETIKAEAAQNAAQQSAFRQAVVDVVSTSQNPLELNVGIPFASLHKEPKIPEAPTGGCTGLNIYSKTVGTPPDTVQQVWVGVGTIAGQTPDGFNPTDGKLIAVGGTGNVWAEVEIDGDTGEINSLNVDGGGTTPENTDTKFYYTLGYFEFGTNSVTITNYGCGGIEVTICRNWFAYEAPFYGVTLARCGCSSSGY